MSFDPDRSAGYVVNHMARLFAAALTERIQPLGLSTGQFLIQLALWAEEGLTQKQLVLKKAPRRIPFYESGIFRRYPELDA